MSTQAVEVIASVDQNVELGLTVLVASLRSSRGDDLIRVNVLVPEGSPRSIVEPAKRAAGDHLEVERVEVPDALLHGATGRYLSPAAYYLLFASELLDAHRAIYIDVDVLVRESLRPLWDADLGNLPLGAVQSLTIPFVGSKSGVRSWRDRNLDPRMPYFNGGVLVLDLEQWRREQHGRAVMDIVRQDYEHFVNQGALNAHFAGRWTALPLRWNQHSTIYAPDAGHETIFALSELDEARNNPAVVHFVGPTKPWHARCEHPYAEPWREIARTVGPPGWTPEREPIRRVVKRRLAKAVIALREG